jgi:DNA-binding CsgD family transcriptional regulator
MELAHFSGAERLVARAREELLAAGARPRQIVRSGFTGLTASERRIVRLVVEGRSNPEIAQALYVSVKTIETHLSNAYRKLDLSGPGARRRLSALVSNAA